MTNQPQVSWGHINQDFRLLYISNKQEMLHRQQITQITCFVPSNQVNTTVLLSIIAIIVKGEY